jgi:spore photoproduct lyase
VPRHSVDSKHVLITRSVAELPHEQRILDRCVIAGMPVDGWREEYAALLDTVAAATADVPDLDLTTELITHRFTPKSKEILLGWYPRTQLEMDDDLRRQKRGKYGAVKHVYPAPVMNELRSWFESALAERLPAARYLYWT